MRKVRLCRLAAMALLALLLGIAMQPLGTSRAATSVDGPMDQTNMVWSIGPQARRVMPSTNPPGQWSLTWAGFVAGQFTPSVFTQVAAQWRVDCPEEDAPAHATLMNFVGLGGVHFPLSAPVFAAGVTYDRVHGSRFFWQRGTNGPHYIPDYPIRCGETVDVSIHYVPTQSTVVLTFQVVGQQGVLAVLHHQLVDPSTAAWVTAREVPFLDENFVPPLAQPARSMMDWSQVRAMQAGNRTPTNLLNLPVAEYNMFTNGRLLAYPQLTGSNTFTMHYPNM